MSKPKVINFELIEDLESEPYRILSEVRNKWHTEIATAIIGLAWRINLAPDKDGHLILGKCVKISDMHRELADYNFVVLLNRQVWEDPDFNEKQKRALIDHELCHAAAATDEEGQKIDNRGRPVWRVRKHDIEEFQGVVQRHGCYKRDLEIFAESLLKKRRTPLLNQIDENTPEPLRHPREIN